MSQGKSRLTVTVDPAAVKAGTEAVSEGRASSLSAWVNQALAERAVKDRQLRALAGAVAAFESEFGILTDAELALQRRLDRAAATVVRGRSSKPPKRRRGAA